MKRITTRKYNLRIHALLVSKYFQEWKVTNLMKICDFPLFLYLFVSNQMKVDVVLTIVVQKFALTTIENGWYCLKERVKVYENPLYEK